MPLGLKGTVVLFLGHEVSAKTQAAFRRLRDTAGEDLTVRWLLDVAGGAQIPPEFVGHVHTYDSRHFADWGLATFGSKMLPGHCHFPVLRFYQQNPRIQHLWVVEYDVRFTGFWADFFEAVSHSDADLLTCHIRTREQEPGWFWWNTLQSPDGTLPPDLPVLRAFLVIARFSAAALKLLIEQQQAGWRGHQETIIPTLVARAGLRLGDINDAAKDSPFHRFYTSVSEPKGSLEELGTMRFRPARGRAGWRRNMLYHPVKPMGTFRRPAFLESLIRRYRILLRAIGLGSKDVPR